MASGNEIERLTVTLEADYSKLVSQTKEGVNQSERELDKLSDAPKKAQSSWEQLGGFLSGKFLAVLTTIGAAVAAAFSVQAITQFFTAIAQGMVAANSQFETFRVQFETLLGSQSEAQKRIDELALFGQKTPFELPEIVEANRLLQTFGGTALATGENLRRIGDSAAAVNASFQEVSFWTGRLYSSMMAGRPFGEASARLQELGILSGDVRTKLEDMQKAGVDGEEIWAAYAEMVDTRFSGAMDRLSKTLQGVMSNLADFQGMLLREGGEDLFEGIREDAIELYDIINDPEATKTLIGLAEAAGALLDAFREIATTPLLESLKEVDAQEMEDLSKSVQDFARALAELAVSDKAVNINSLTTAVTALTDSFTLLLISLNKTKDVASAVAIPIKAVKDAIIGAIAPIYTLIRGFDALNDALEVFTGSGISDYTRGLVDDFDSTNEALDGIATAGENAFNKLQEGARKKAAEASEAIEEVAEDFTKAREKFEALSESFAEAQEEIGKKREEVEKDHGERIAKIAENYGEAIADLEEEIADRREEIVEDTAEKLADLEEEGAERREEIARNTAKALARLEQETAEAKADAIASAQEDLADLEKDTRNSVAEVQEEANEKERRETEDHQREMQRLQQNYLLNLEDAVKNRDARAIVDLRRKYNAEKTEREEDFRTQQTRSREDAREKIEDAREAEEERRREIEEALEKQLEEIEENEAKKREEIEASQQEQLEQLAASEAEKRAEIEESQAEQLAKLEELEAEKRAKIEESLAEQLAAEQESYEERQALLDEALQRKLEAVAQELATEKEITEQGAEAILETLNQYYGAGGRMDQVMEAYRQRQQQMQQSMNNFDANLPGGGPGGGDFVPAGSGGGAGIPAFAQGGIVPGRPGQRRLIIAHAGELVIPPDQTAQWMSQQGNMMASNLDNSPKVVELKVSGSAPPGIKGAEVEQIAGLMVQALNEAGIRTKRR